jgi:hypothetical protein
VLVGKPEEKRPLGRPRRRWEDNIKWLYSCIGIFKNFSRFTFNFRLKKRSVTNIKNIYSYKTTSYCTYFNLLHIYVYIYFTTVG